MSSDHVVVPSNRSYNMTGTFKVSTAGVPTCIALCEDDNVLAGLDALAGLDVFFFSGLLRGDRAVAGGLSSSSYLCSD